MSDKGKGAELTRRNIVKSSLVGGSALLAGCSSDSGNQAGTSGGTGATTSNTTGGGDGQTTTFTLGTTTNRVEFDQMHYNPYDPDNLMGGIDPAGIIYDPLMMWFTSRNQWEPYIADWTLDGDVVELQFSEDWTWHDGDQLTASDYYTSSQLGLEVSRVQSGEEDPSQWVAGYELVDDFTMRINLQDEFAKTWTLRNAVGTGLTIIKEDLGEPRTYKQWLEEIRDAEGEEAKQLVSKLTQWTQEKPVGNGPFKIKEVTPSEIVTERFDDHPYADQIGIDEYRFQATNDVVLSYQEKQVDGIMRNLPATEDTQSRLPESHPISREQISIRMICMNHGQYDHPNSGAEAGAYEPYTSDRAVRKAIGYIVDRNRIQSVMPSNVKPFNWAPCWLSPTDIEQDVYDLSGYETYDQDHEKAASLLQEAGYSEQDGTWVDDSGDPMEIQFMTPSGDAIGLPMGQATVDELKSFGIPATLESVDGATFGERRFAGDYDLMVDGSDGTSTVMTWDSFAWTWLAGLHHGPDEYEVPMPVGDPSGSEGTAVINIQDEITQWARSGDKQHPQRMAWAWNQALPRYEMVFQPNGGAIRADKWGVSGPEPLVQNRPAEKNLVKHPDGSITPK